MTPVTTTVTRRVRPGHEAFYEQFLEGIISAARRLPGHLGVEVFGPSSAAAGEYRTVYRFDSAEHLRAWLDSDEHAAWLERAEPHVVGPMRTRFVAITGPLLDELPLVLRLGITTALAVPLMTWVVMPRATRLLRRWLYPTDERTP